MIIYNSASQYLGTATTLQERIARLEAIIDALLLKSVDAVEGVIYEEYELDDGQTKIKARYRGLSAIQAAIIGYERIKNIYLNRLYGPSVVLVNGKNLPG